MHITVEIPGYEIISAMRNKGVLTTRTDSGRVILPPELVVKAVVRVIK